MNKNGRINARRNYIRNFFSRILQRIRIRKPFKSIEMDKQKKELVKKAVEVLIATSKVTTTLEVKNYLRITEPKFKWNQSDISVEMDNLLKIIPGLLYFDNGQFREYMIKSFDPISIPTVKVKKTKTTKKDIGTGVKISRTAMVKILKESKGKFCTVTFVKTDGSERVMNGNIKADNFMNELGYIKFKERNGNHRLVNPKTLISLKAQGKIYVI